MNDIVDLLDLREILPPVLLEQACDFESLYDHLADTPEFEDLVDLLETSVREYFVDLLLPSTATMYDRLILSLRPKDVIATFNWDPFLIQAYRRNAHLRELPCLAFLHGNVAMGACAEHRQLGYLDQICQECREPFQPSALLYPIRNKDYKSDPVIQDQWATLERVLENAYYLTIYGYSAPRSDKVAMELMRAVWDANQTRDLAQIEIIDIADRDELERRWRPFIVRRHFGISTTFGDSWLSQYPRRTCEALAHYTQLNLPFSGLPFPQGEDLEELQTAVNPLIDEELEFRRNRTPFRTNWNDS